MSGTCEQCVDLMKVAKDLRDGLHMARVTLDDMYSDLSVYVSNEDTNYYRAQMKHLRAFHADACKRLDAMDMGA